MPSSPTRLACSHTTIRPAYDAVVVGSGYGAGIAASRLARMGLSVCILERGREFLPGDFPKTLMDGGDDFQIDAPRGRAGSKLGLFDMRINGDVSVMVGCGLGGTSLINGNVMLQPDPRVLADPVWPATFRAETETTLREGYRRAMAMLEPVPYPADAPTLRKLAAFKAQAHGVGGRVTRPPIAVTFAADPAGNAAGVLQPPCTLCGDCCSGCNVGAKNTVAMNYLPDAANHGAEIFTLARVTHVERDGARWRVVFENHDDVESETMRGARTVTAGIVVLGAGTLGTTEVLLRSRDRGLSLSRRLGERFSGNGDVIAFGYNNDVPVNGIGTGHPPRVAMEPVGPVIAGLVDLRAHRPLAGGIVIQEGAIPSVLAPILPLIMKGVAPLFGTDTDTGDWFAEAARSWKSLFMGAYVGAAHNTQTFLVMAHDAAAGRIRLDDDRARIDWPDAGDQPIYERISDVLEHATAATGGTFVDNPLWSAGLGRNLVSVHPLGGCGMGEDADHGVVDDKNRVFSDDGRIHDGLYVCDGAAIPRSLGVNPGLTISAIAERAMIHLARDRSLPEAA